MIIFAQLCYCIYYENYYNPFIMKNKKNNFYLMGVVFIAILGGLLFGYDTAVISGAEQALQKHLGLDAFWHGVTASSALIGCVIGSAFSGRSFRHMRQPDLHPDRSTIPRFLYGFLPHVRLL